jgi:hypothetical protein
MEIQTSDLYLVGYLLSQQIPIKTIKQTQSNSTSKPRIIFIFNRTSHVNSLAYLFKMGQAKANVQNLKHHITYARDLMFDTLRESQGVNQ